MDKEMASIIFMPVCTKCLKIIWQEIDGLQSVDVIRDSPRILGATYYISPYNCPHCGALFNSIIMPTKLPFNPYDFNDYIT